MNKKILIPSVIALLVLLIGVNVYYYSINRSRPTGVKPTACTMEAKLCPDGTAVGRSGPDCAFAPCPAAPVDETAGWKTLADSGSGFEFKYPDGFFGASQEPKIFSGACNYEVFPASCPNIDNLIIEEERLAGSDINAIKSNLAAPNYWTNKGGELTLNNEPYCLYQTNDAGMGHVYATYYYVTVKNGKCLVVNFVTATTNCDFYLPLETGNTEQKKNYEACLATNQNQPKILGQIQSTFKFSK
jgi:hypothetical protein